tara:strand:- start:21051 stop:21917 length:867 start_codon:yes stop_codon:yes gene_type:complete
MTNVNDLLAEVEEGIEMAEPTEPKKKKTAKKKPAKRKGPDKASKANGGEPTPVEVKEGADSGGGKDGPEKGIDKPAARAADIIEQGVTKMAPEAPKLIFQLLPIVTAEIGAIRKEQQNSHQKYRYRGIDDALNQISPVLCKHGICTEVQVLDHVVASLEGGSKVIYHATLSLQVRFFAPDGSSVLSRAAGEGLSHADDKATAKAMSGAMKYALYFGLMIPVDRDELADPDKEAAESEAVTTAKRLIQQADTKQRVKELVKRVQESAAFTDEQKAALTFQAETKSSELK